MIDPGKTYTAEESVEVKSGKATNSPYRSQMKNFWVIAVFQWSERTRSGKWMNPYSSFGTGNGGRTLQRK